MRRHHRLRLHEPGQPVAARSARRTTVARTLAAGQRTPGGVSRRGLPGSPTGPGGKPPPVTWRTLAQGLCGWRGPTWPAATRPWAVSAARCSSCSRAFRSTVPTPGPAVARCRIARCSAMPQRRPARISTKPTGRSSTISNAGSAGSRCASCRPVRWWRLRGELLARFQQLSSPTAAKAVEDTACYRSAALLAQRRRLRPAALRRFRRPGHAARARRPASLRALLATASHDHKRGEDARARLAALSELAPWFARNVEHWQSRPRRCAATSPRGRRRVPATS